MSEKTLIVSLHDVHGGSLDVVRRQAEELGALGIGNFSLLVVPQYHHGRTLKEVPALLEWLDARHGAGDDLVVHGYYHDRQDRAAGSLFWDRLYTADESEFQDLSDGEVRHRLDRARTFWNERGWRAEGFIAPAWLMPETQDLLLKRAGFSYTTRIGTVKSLAKDAVTNAQSLCYSSRAPWRRSLSLLWNQWLFSRLRKGKTVRLSLHPGDWEWPRPRRQILEIAEMALAEGFRPLTYAQYVRQM